MTQPIAIAFNPKCVVLPIEGILPLKKVDADPKTSPICGRILASIREIGLAEPLVVYPQPGSGDRYLLLDGHLRLEIIKQLGKHEVLCLIATEDEAYTYNHKV